MRGVAFSIVVPTCGRRSLAATLASVDDQLDPGDECIVVADGRGAGVVARQVLADFADDGDPAYRYLETGFTGRWGNAQRDLGAAVARGTHLLFIDDDDVYEPEALAIVRQALADDGAVAHIFRMRFGPNSRRPGLTLWRDQIVRPQNLGTPMVVLPNRRELLPLWAAGDSGDTLSDFLFLRKAIPRFGHPVWQEAVVVVVRP